MHAFNIFGLIILILGVFLIGFGARSTQTMADKVVGGLTGRYTRRTMLYLIGGAILILIGGGLLFYY